MRTGEPSRIPCPRSDFILAHGQEFHTGFWGHIGLVGLREHYLLPDYAGYPRTALESLYPTNTAVSELGRAQGALVGYVHPFDFAPDLSRLQGGVPYELPVGVALGKVDYLEVMGYSTHLETSEIWYRLLNCGFRIPAGAGTDAFPNFASLRGPPGLVRVYAQVQGRFTHCAWLDAVKAGRTFVTNAPLLEFSLGAHQIGDDVRLGPGSHTVRAQSRDAIARYPSITSRSLGIVASSPRFRCVVTARALIRRSCSRSPKADGSCYARAPSGRDFPCSICILSPARVRSTCKSATRRFARARTPSTS